KTTLAQIIANQLDRPFHILSAINSGVKDIREVIDKAKSQRFFNAANPILFIDEIHRFSKSQQDSLLGAVEKGVVTLIGATTENPSFEVISALLSRCQVYVLKHLEKEQLEALLKTAIEKDEYLKEKSIELEETAAILQYSGGDARKLLNILELVTNQAVKGEVLKITDELVTECIQQNILIYDKSGEMHYDLASALIKSMRGSDPNAAIYYLARMLEGGEDIEFIARRLIILAAEDIGLANPNALLMATTSLQAIRTVGMPEARIILAQAVIYLATSSKSNSAYMAIEKASEEVKKSGNLSIPLKIRNAPTKLMKDLNYGKDYLYAHQFENNFIELEFLPEAISGMKFFEPGNNAQEESVRQRLRFLWKEKYGY
ncbi:MAG TPA: replication-associated recombination protein A, partial [Saprospiraceae bacterium]|nr:replication-associated recombination protein A [Saprospiraceae bacterium]